MADPIDRASSYRFGVALGENLVGLFGEDIQPDISPGYAAPQGSLLFSPTFGLYRKVGPSDDDWAKLAGATGFGYFSFSAGVIRNASEGDYLELAPSVGMNQVPFVVPFDCDFVAMSLATNGPETWRLMTQYFDQNTLTWIDTDAYLDVAGQDFANSDDYNIAGIPAGTKLAFQIQNAPAQVNKPRGFAFLRRL